MEIQKVNFNVSYGLRVTLPSWRQAPPSHAFLKCIIHNCFRKETFYLDNTRQKANYFGIIIKILGGMENSSYFCMKN